MTSNIVNVQNEQTHTDTTIIALTRTTYIIYSFICYFYMICSSENDYKKAFEGSFPCLDPEAGKWSVYILLRVKMNTLQLSTPIRVEYLNNCFRVTSAQPCQLEVTATVKLFELMICSFENWANRAGELTCIFPLNHQDRTRSHSANRKRMLCVTWSTQEQIPKHWGHSNEPGIVRLMNSDFKTWQICKKQGGKITVHTHTSSVLPNQTYRTF